MIELLIFIAVYLSSSWLSNYTTLGRYQWFMRLTSELMFKFPNKMGLIVKIMSFKGFHCTSCHSFWIAFGMYLALGLPNGLLYALIVYIFNQIDSLHNTKNDDVKGHE